MGKIVLIRHGQASFGQPVYDQLSETGKYQAEVTGCYFEQAKIKPTAIYSGTLKRQKETARIVVQHAGLKSEIIEDQIYNEYFYQAIIDSQLPGLLESDPTVSEDVDKAFTDLQAFQRVFSKLLKRWVSGNYDAEGVETFKSYTKRMIDGINAIASKQDNDDIAVVFTSGGFIAMSMHLILGIQDTEALKLGWQIYNCSLTSFYCNDNSFQLETFNSIGHLEMDASPGILSHI